jgi:hypothetical protein
MDHGCLDPLTRLFADGGQSHLEVYSLGVNSQREGWSPPRCDDRQFLVPDCGATNSAFSNGSQDDRLTVDTLVASATGDTGHRPGHVLGSVQVDPWGIGYG